MLGTNSVRNRAENRNITSTGTISLIRVLNKCCASGAATPARVLSCLVDDRHDFTLAFLLLFPSCLSFSSSSFQRGWALCSTCRRWRRRRFCPSVDSTGKKFSSADKFVTLKREMPKRRGGGGGRLTRALQLTPSA